MMPPLSAHIVRHLLLALVIPALLWLLTPRRLASAALQRRSVRKLERAVGQPPVSWLLGVGTMLAWHVPALFHAALANESLHILQSFSFLVTGLIFWWPILSPLEDRHLPALAAVSYLFSACLCCTLMGAFLTFGPAGLYTMHPGTMHPGDASPDPKGDQQLAGLLMWVPGCFIYLTAILFTVRRWYTQEMPA